MRLKNRIIASFVAIMVLVGVCIPAQAAGTGSVTVKNVQVGETYGIYKMLDVTTDGGTGYSYEVATGWEDFFSTGAGSTYFDVNQGEVTLKNGVTDEQIATMAAEAVAYATTESLTAVASETATSKDPITFSALDFGYYAIDSTLGSVVSLTTLAPTAEVIDKNQKATLDKAVKLADSSWGKEKDGAIGEKLEYRITMTAPNYVGENQIKEYVIHDTLESGLSLDGTSVVVSVNGSTLGATEATVNTSGCSTGHSLCVTIPWVDADNESLYISDTKGAINDVVITYSAKLNENAEIGTANTNTASTTWSYTDGNNGSTNDYPPSVDVDTYTWGLELLKVDGTDSSIVLAGAEFSVYTNAALSERVNFTEINGVYYVDEDGVYDTTNKTTLVTNASGKIAISGLNKGTYYIVETKAPSGYNLMTQTITVEIDGSTPVLTTTVKNNKGAQLPSTGGMGTTIFYVVGLTMMLGSVVILLTKKVMESKKRA